MGIIYSKLPCLIRIERTSKLRLNILPFFYLLSSFHCTAEESLQLKKWKSTSSQLDVSAIGVTGFSGNTKKSMA